jgi:transposase
MRTAPTIILDEEVRGKLVKWARGRSTPMRLVQRARIVLSAAGGRRNKDIAEELGVSRKMVGIWRKRFAEGGIEAIMKDAPRGGRPMSVRAAVARIVIEKTTRETPTDATHWSTRTMAKEVGCSRSTVQRIWNANGLKPHLQRTFKVSRDPDFEEKTRDVVGLYLDPPKNALVLSFDEKSQIQALDRTQPSLPMRKGRNGTKTHDYKRNGTTTLFAAMDVAGGTVISSCMKRHRHQEFLRFLKKIDKEAPPDLEIHLILDNYATHKHKKVKQWLKSHNRFHFHFIPTSSSWLNMIERFFAELTNKRIRRGAFRNVPSLIDAIEAFIDHHNQNSRSYAWTAKADDIIEKVRRARAVLEGISNHQAATVH